MVSWFAYSCIAPPPPSAFICCMKCHAVRVKGRHHTVHTVMRIKILYDYRRMQLEFVQHTKCVPTLQFCVYKLQI
jgi:hypothetical protein